MIDTLKEIIKKKSQSELVDEILFHKHKISKAKRTTKTPEERLSTIRERVESSIFSFKQILNFYYKCL